MKYLVPLALVLLLTLAAVAQDLPSQASQASQGRREVLTNESVINLSRAGFKERTIVTLIRTSETAFDISTPKLVELKKRGVNERIISEMIERTNSGEAMRRLTTLRNDDFFSKADEDFFNGSSIFKEVPTEKEAKQKEDEALLFGSKSGGNSKARSRGWGPNGERSQNAEVMGSASVRIIRPAGEGGAQPKLERAPKLDNHGVLEMVQAGFSEGTIIRKIEAAQVDFDLSAKALVELKQNRVSERIIKAMTTAMDESK